MRRNGAFLITAWSFVLPAQAANRDAILQMTFDRNIAMSGKDSFCRIDRIGDATEFVQGVEGDALVVQDKPPRGVRLHFPDRFPEKAGSLSLWVCPLDWNYDDRLFHMFFTAAFFPP